MVSSLLLIAVGVAAALVACALLWRYASRLAAQAEEEEQWREYIDQLRLVDPSQAAYWQELFEQKFLRKSG